MSQEEITLYGGPGDRKVYAVESNTDEVYIKVMMPVKHPQDRFTDFYKGKDIPLEESSMSKGDNPIIEVRTVKYSRVGKTSDFEYDGYLPEDDPRSI